MMTPDKLTVIQLVILNIYTTVYIAVKHKYDMLL